jgi:Glycosyl hydrolase family 81 C-terminal domain
VYSHFHYGYHIYAAAALAHFDPKWGMDYFEQVTMLVRDIANPSKDDSFFPTFRHKDWYQGSSWASGLISFLNGRNQESSSEAIAAYEGVALFGQEMREIWRAADQPHKAAVADEIAKAGKLLTGTELTSAKRYWHVNRLGDPDRIYPREYEATSIGILWNTMSQFGTWFGAAPYLPIGIQLLPLTAISEVRDDDWANLIYKPLTKYCAADFKCTESGWSILQLAILATVGYADEAAMRVKELPDDSFENAGGNGQSRTNTLWYISTRPVVVDPIPILRYDMRGQEEVQPKPLYALKDCYLPETCTDSVLDRIASEFTCRERMTFLIEQKQMTEWEACWRIGGLEFPDICGQCNPGVHFVSKQEEEDDKKKREEEAQSEKIDMSPLQCQPCTHEECNSDLNSCPVYKRTFVCTEGTSKFGCSGDPHFWVEEKQCDSCCEMTHCLDLKDKEGQKVTHDGNALETSNCPPCPPSICYGKINQCPIHTAPYLCTKGSSWGGCASSPWSLHEGQCTECCEIKVEC